MLKDILKFIIDQNIILLKKLLPSFRSAENGIRQGYMGHLINIANNIVNQREDSESLDKFLKDNLSSECLDKWDDLVNTKLSKINKTHQIFLVYLNSYKNLRIFSLVLTYFNII